MTVIAVGVMCTHFGWITGLVMLGLAVLAIVLVEQSTKKKATKR